MLPQVHHQHYQKLRQAVERLQVELAHLEKNTDLMPTFLNVKHLFQLQIVTLSSDELTPEMQNKVRSYQTEIHKQLRLLGTDLTFLQAARQTSTLEQRRTQIQERLTTLIGYCEVLLQNC